MIRNPFPHPSPAARPDLLHRGAGILLLAVCLAISGCAGLPAPSPATTAGSTARATASTPVPRSTSLGASRRDRDRTAAAPGTALAGLAALAVKGRAPKTGYTRAQFGHAWADVDHNGCDTRNDILARDLVHTAVKPGTRGCVIASGVLDDPYTGRVIDFRRGERTSAAVQIDHVVALSDAWQTGAQRLSASQREQLANDPLNLLAVDGPSNQQKSDADAATWLPANKAFRCQYVARQVAVKTRYALWVTRGEHDAIARVLAGCRDQRLPTASAPTAKSLSPARRPGA